MSSSRYPYLIAAVAAISGLLFGFDTAVINGALIFLREELDLTTKGTEIATTSLLVGCAVGAAFAGVLTDRFGRKRLLIVSALLFAASAVGAAVPRVLEEFVAARFVGGLAIGVASVLAPLYIAEISPREIRGRLVSLNQMAIVTGILLAYFTSWSLSFLGSLELALDVRLRRRPLARLLHRAPLRARVPPLPRREGPARPTPSPCSTG